MCKNKKDRLKINSKLVFNYKYIYKDINVNFFLNKRLLEIQKYFYRKYHIDYFSFHFFSKNHKYYLNQNLDIMWHIYNWKAVKKNYTNIFSNNEYFLKSYKTQLQDHDFIFLNSPLETILYKEITNKYKEFTTIGLKDLEKKFKILITFGFIDGNNINSLNKDLYVTLINDINKLKYSLRVFFDFYIKYGHMDDNTFFFKYIINNDIFIL
jgi:hypothetical protein